MRLSSLTFKNLTRNKLRTALTVMAIALPLMIFTVARSGVQLFQQILADSDRNLRVTVHHKLNFTLPLPERLRGDIETLAPPGTITAVCRSTWFGGRVEGEQTISFASFGVDRDTFPIVYSEFGMTAEDLEAFSRERRGAIIHPRVAARMNWKIGDRIELVGMIPPNPRMEFIIVAIPKDMPFEALYMARDYYSEVWRQLTDSPLWVNHFWLKCAGPQAREWALSTIDKSFANSEHETRSEMESTFVEGITKSRGDWTGMVWMVGQIVILVAVAVAFNTISTGFRERVREYALLRALGFQRGRIVRMILAEGLLLGATGGLLAVVPAAALTWMFDISPPRMGPVRIPPETILMTLAAATGCGLLAAVLPACLAGRLAVAASLRKVV